MENRARLIFKRWMSVLVYAVLGTGISAIIIEPLLAPWVNKISSNYFFYLVIFLILVSIILSQVRNLIDIKHIKVALLHPPYWFSAIAGFLFILPLSVSQYFSIVFAIILIALFLYFDMAKVIRPIDNNIDEDFKQMAGDIKGYSAAKLLEWANREVPLKNKGLLFGREKYAERIYNRLFSNNNQQGATSCALLGELGSGKSSVINAVLDLLKQRAPEWLPVKVDAWARDAKTIDEQILDLIIDKIGEVTDVTAYKNVPSAYRDALKSHGNWWATLSHLMAGTASTESKLKRIDNLLNVLNKKIILIIEDPDRGIDKERCCERIFALLDRLRLHTILHIKIIVTGGEGLLNGDLRVIEFKETLNTPAKEFAAILNTISDKLWGEKIVEGLPDIIFPDGKPKFTFKDFPFGTPRDVKHVIRDVDALWVSPGELRGEINLKQLVLLSFAKELSLKGSEWDILLYLKKWQKETLSDNARRHYYIPRNGHSWREPNTNLFDDNKEGKNTIRHQLSNINQTLKEMKGNNNELEKGGHANFFSNMSIKNKRITQEICREIINESGRYQSIDTGGRINYLERFLIRSAGNFHSKDVEFSNSTSLEKLDDQEYLKVMNEIFSLLKQDKKSLPDASIDKFLSSGAISKYFYDKMILKNETSLYFCEEWFTNSQSHLDAYKTLAFKIIERMESLPYTKNDIGHPAGEHLEEIILQLGFLVDAADYDNNSVEFLAIEIIEKALLVESEAGGTLLSSHSEVLIGWLSQKISKSKIWELYKLALDNPKITPIDFNNQEKFNWRYLKEIVQSSSNTLFDCLESVKEIRSLNDDDYHAIKQLINLLEKIDKDKLKKDYRKISNDLEIEVVFGKNNISGKVDELKKMLKPSL